MKEALYFLAGALLGLGGGYLIGKRKKEKKTEAIVKTVTVEAEENDDEDEEEKEKDVKHLVREYGYSPEDDGEDYDYDRDDLDSDIEDVQDYLSTIEHPEDDEPIVREDFVPLTDDEYFSERHEFDKIKLFLDESGSQLVDSLGNDYLDIFAQHGLSRERLIDDALKHEMTAYYRNDKMESDFEVLYEGGE